MATQTIVDGSTLSAASWANDVDTAAYMALTSVSGSNTIAATGPANYSFTSRHPISWIQATTNTGATTLNITPSGGAALGAKNVFVRNGTCVGGELLAGMAYQAVYDGTQYQVIGNSAFIGVATATSVDIAGTGAGVRSMFLRTGGLLSIYDSGGTERGRINATTTGGGTTVINATVNDAAGELQMLAGKFYITGVGTTASAANAFINSGSSPTDQILRSTSSLKYKDDLQDMTLAEAQKVTFGLHGFSYASNSVSDDPDKRWIGYGAEEIAPLDGRFVTFDADGAPNWVQYERFVIPHGIVLTDHEARITALEAEIQLLKAAK